MHWDGDGPNGPDMKPNSISILLEWWTTEGNYSCYRGGKNHSGKSKESHWANISRKIQEARICVERSPESIGQKLYRIEEQYHKAADWLGNTGTCVGARGLCSKWNFELLSFLL